MPSVYLDTCIFVAAFETTDSRADRARRLFRALERNPETAVTSELSLGELLAPVKRPQVMSVAERREIYFDLFDRIASIRLVPITRSILLETVSIREWHPQRIPDAIHISTAMSESCRYFVSYDRDIRRLPQELSWAAPGTPDFDQILRALDA